ncbi:hypothetical protein J3Q64DRAFT_1633168, partial [Phycomyces blakesleeanus]
NDDWRFLTQLRFACAHISVGAIIINKNNEAIIINTGETYNRQRTLDAHRETFVNKKEMAVVSFLLPVETKYYNA